VTSAGGTGDTPASLRRGYHEQPTKFELAINLNTAKEKFMQRADTLIE
jgi:hypothetical protein